MELLNLKDILQKLTADREKMIEENDKVLVEVLCCHNSCWLSVVVIVVVSFAAAVIFVVVVVVAMIVICALVLSYSMQIKRDLDQFVSEKITLVAELDDRKVLLDSTQIQFQVSRQCSLVSQFNLIM